MKSLIIGKRLQAIGGFISRHLKIAAIWVDGNRGASLLVGLGVLLLVDGWLIAWTTASLSSWDYYCSIVEKPWVPYCRVIFTAGFIIGTKITATLALRRFQFFG